MKWLAYLNDNKNTIIIAISGAMLADCVVLFAFRRYFKNALSPNAEALRVLRADVASLRSEVFALRCILDEISATKNTRSSKRASETENPNNCPRPQGFIRNSASVLSLSSDGDYYDALDDWVEKVNYGELPISDDQKCIEVIRTVDAYFEEQSGVVAYRVLKEVLENNSSLADDPEILWRMAKACKMYSNTFEKGDSMRKNLVLEGRNYSLKAYYASPSCFESVRWAALMTGLATDYVSMKEKIKLGGEFKEYLDKAIGMRPGEVSLLYMRGRYSYAIANLSWLERKAASALFGAVPQATIDDAIKDLLAVEQIKPNAWIDNLLFLGKCYIAKKDEVNAVKYLKLATNIKTEDDSDEESLREAYTLLEKYSK